MLWTLGRIAVRGAGSVLSAPRGQSGPDPYKVPVDSEEGRRSGVTGLVIFLLLLGPAGAILVQGYKGHITLGACIAYCVAFWSLLAVLWAVSAVARAVSGLATLNRYAAPPPADTTARDFRERARQLRALEPQEDSTPTVPLPVLDPRERRVQALFAVECPVWQCRAPVGIPCMMGIGIPVAIVRKYPLAFCHVARINRAVRDGSASEADVEAQFDNNMPSGVL